MSLDEGIENKLQKALEQISDWYLPENDPLSGFIYPSAANIKTFPFLYDIAAELMQQCIEKTSISKGKDKNKNKEVDGENTEGYDEFVAEIAGRKYRGHKINTIEGPVFALRRMPQQVPSLADLGLEPALRNILLSPSLNRGGLILLCGETGQGKSTTCAATIKERMLALGCFTLTVEDPPEMPLHGTHGNGRCLQTEVISGEFAEALKGAMRCYPSVPGSILYVGETRDGETAAEVLRIAMNGNLVFTTLHANDVPSGLKRMVSLASTKMGQKEAEYILASVFRVGLHQVLEPMKPIPGQAERKKLSVSFLISSSGQTPIANKIRRGETESLGTDLQQQRTILAQHGSAALMKLWE